MKSNSKFRKIGLFMLFISSVCCKDNTTKPEEIIEEKKPIEKSANDLKLFIDGFFSEDDEVTLHFEDIQGQDSVVEKIKGMPNNWQRVSFNFPEETIPYSFKVSFSKKRKNTIRFDKIVLNKNDDRIIIKDSTLLVYFQLKNLNHKFINDKLILEKTKENNDYELISKENLNSRIQNRYIRNNP